MRPLLTFLGAVASSALAYPALGQAQLQGPSLVYDGPTSCASQAEFIRRFRDRLPASQANVGAGQKLSVNIVQADGQYVGRVLLITQDARSMTKTLSARDCKGLVDALALVAALAVRPSAREGTVHDEGPEARTSSRQPADAETAAATAPASESPVASGQRPAPASTGQSPSADSQPAQGSRPAAARDADVLPTRSANSAPRSRLGGDLGTAVTSGLAPDAVVSGLLGLDWALDRAGVFSPALGLGATAGAAPQVTRPGGKAIFTWLGARVSGCAVRLAVGRVIQVRGCLLADIGWVLARGSDTLSPGSSSRAWLSLGASSQFEFPVGERWALRLLVGGEAPIRHDRYAFGSDHFFQVPILTATGSASLVAYFH